MHSELSWASNVPPTHPRFTPHTRRTADFRETPSRTRIQICVSLIVCSGLPAA